MASNLDKIFPINAQRNLYLQKRGHFKKSFDTWRANLIFKIKKTMKQNDLIKGEWTSRSSRLYTTHPHALNANRKKSKWYSNYPSVVQSFKPSPLLNDQLVLYVTNSLAVIITQYLHIDIDDWIRNFLLVYYQIKI